jgi:hypothetical protein
MAASVPPVRDGELAALYDHLIASGTQVLFIANAFTVAMWQRSDTSNPWIFVRAGEFGNQCVTAVGNAVRKNRTFWLATKLAVPQDEDVAAASPSLVKVGLVKSWLKKSDEITGRFGNASPEVKKEVAYLAANRCQFSGCGRDLGRHASTGEKTNASYFAHIVAASADGPRGDPIQSPILADDANNFLLLCDECHRLIDKTAVDKYTVDELRKMRSQSIQEVRRLLDTLQFPDAEVLYIIGNVTGQMPHISERDMDEAMWESRLRRSPKAPESYFEIGRQHYQPHEPGYWSAVFRTLALELPQLQSKLNGMRNGGGPRPRLAVFPLHGTSILILAGRVLGDMAGTHVFQPHRNKVGNAWETRWAWPEDATLPAPDKFQLATRKDRLHNEDEANLIVSLTFPVTAARMAPVSANEGLLTLPTLEISVEAFGHSSIRHPADLVAFGTIVDEALRMLQDVWQVQKIHLYVGAPASAAMLIGQKMQARHQATFVCYESLSGNGAAFASTIEISATQVTAPGVSQGAPLQS